MLEKREEEAERCWGMKRKKNEKGQEEEKMEKRKAVEEGCADEREKREKDVEAGQPSLSGNVSFFFSSQLADDGGEQDAANWARHKRQRLNQCSTYLRPRLSVSEAEPQGKKTRKIEEVGGVVRTRGRESKRPSPGQAGDGFVFGG